MQKLFMILVVLLVASFTHGFKPAKNALVNPLRLRHVPRTEYPARNSKMFAGNEPRITKDREGQYFSSEVI